jgi:type I restriction enzyme, S subunit
VEGRVLTEAIKYATQVIKQGLPDGWRLVKVADIGPVVDGDWILNSDYAPQGVRLLQVGDVGIERFIGKSSRFITLERAKELNCTLLEPGDILISRMPDPIGRACTMPDIGYPCITAVDVSIWRPRVEEVDRVYLVSVTGLY